MKLKNNEMIVLQAIAKKPGRHGLALRHATGIGVSFYVHAKRLRDKGMIRIEQVQVQNRRLAAHYPTPAGQCLATAWNTFTKTIGPKGRKAIGL